jgi:hypothetical protein
MKQFACAWVYDDRQILAYVWQDNHEQNYVTHKTQDPDLRLEFTLNFKDEVAAQTYLSNVQHSRADVRKKIENIFDGLFEKAGKDYENEDHPEDPQEEDQLLGGYDN